MYAPLRTVRRLLAKARNSALKPKERMNLVEFTERYLKHPVDSATPGADFKVDELAVTRAVYLWFNEPGVREAFIMACTQSGKTTVMCSIFAYIAAMDPSPIFYVGPTEGDARKFMDGKQMPIMRMSPKLRGLIREGRNTENTKLWKIFPGGRARAVSSDTANSFTMLPERIILIDEKDRHKDAGGEGDTTELSRGRTPEYSHNYFIFSASTPTVKKRDDGLTSIWEDWKDSDQRLPFVQCQQCGHDHFMEWVNTPSHRSLNFEKNEGGTFLAETATYICPSCGFDHDEKARLKMLKPGAIHWRATRPFYCCGEYQDPQKAWLESDQDQAAYERIWQPFGEELGIPAIGFGTHAVDRAKCKKCGTMPVSNKRIGAHYSRFYRERTTLEEIAQGWIDALRSPSKRKVFFNTVLGLPYEEEASQSVDADYLESIGETNWAIVEGSDPDDPVYHWPEAACIATMGIDVQTGKADGSGEPRFAVGVRAWAPGEESWSLDYREVPANVSDVREWDRVLLPLIERTWSRKSDGREFYCNAICIDSGNKPDLTNQFVARHRVRLEKQGIFLYSIKGASERLGPGEKPKAIWPESANSKNKWNVKTWIVGTITAKNEIAEQLQIRTPGPLCFHFPKRYKHWFDGLTSEVWERRKGRLGWYTKKDHSRNEPLDCAVYELAGLRSLQNNPRIRLDLERQAVAVDARSSAIVAAEEDADAANLSARPEVAPVPSNQADPVGSVPPTERASGSVVDGPPPAMQTTSAGSAPKRRVRRSSGFMGGAGRSIW